MILLSGNRTAFWLAGAVCISLLVVSGAADARRGQGGGFSRSSPASSGSVSSGGIENRGAVARQGGSDAARSRAIRNADLLEARNQPAAHSQRVVHSQPVAPNLPEGQARPAPLM